MFICLYSPCLKKLCFHKHKPVLFLKHIIIFRHSHNSKFGLKARIWETLTCFQKEQPNLPHTINNIVCICVGAQIHTQHIGYSWQELLRHFMEFDPSHRSLIFLSPRIIWQMLSPTSPRSCSFRSLQALLRLCGHRYKQCHRMDLRSLLTALLHLNTPSLGGSPVPAASSPSGAFWSLKSSVSGKFCPISTLAPLSLQWSSCVKSMFYKQCCSLDADIPRPLQMLNSSQPL